MTEGTDPHPRDSIVDAHEQRRVPVLARDRLVRVLDRERPADRDRAERDQRDRHIRGVARVSLEPAQAGLVDDHAGENQPREEDDPAEVEQHRPNSDERTGDRQAERTRERQRGRELEALRTHDHRHHDPRREVKEGARE